MNPGAGSSSAVATIPATPSSGSPQKRRRSDDLVHVKQEEIDDDPTWPFVEPRWMFWNDRPKTLAELAAEEQLHTVARCAAHTASQVEDTREQFYLDFPHLREKPEPSGLWQSPSPVYLSDATAVNDRSDTPSDKAHRSRSNSPAPAVDHDGDNEDNDEDDEEDVRSDFGTRGSPTPPPPSAPSSRSHPHIPMRMPRRNKPEPDVEAVGLPPNMIILFADDGRQEAYSVSGPVLREIARYIGEKMHGTMPTHDAGAYPILGSG
jgi:hypothetical protein